MRQLLLILILIAVATPVFSESESSIGLGFGWGNFFENTKEDGDAIKTYVGSPGITLDSFQFWNGHNIGLFANVGFLFPTKMTMDINGAKNSVDLSLYDFLFQDSIMIGSGFRYNINERFTLLCGLGLDFLMTFGKYTRETFLFSNVTYSMLTISLGIGSDIGIKFDITDIVFIKLGSTLAYDFLCYSSASSNVSSVSVSGWASNYSMFSFRPYLCIGLNIYATETGFGKAKLGKTK